MAEKAPTQYVGVVITQQELARLRMFTEAEWQALEAQRAAAVKAVPHE